MEFRLNEAIESLAATPATVDALLRGRQDAWVECRKGPGTFSPRDILGHLIFGEMTDWIPRARQILEGRGSSPFEPFDRFGHQRLVEGRPLGDLLDRFAVLRRESIEALGAFALDEQKLKMPGTHPELGPVTLRPLLATWVVHDLGHIAQLMRVMANEYRDEVGPWRAFLTIL
jgi:DinB superfamily